MKQCLRYIPVCLAVLLCPAEVFAQANLQVVAEVTLSGREAVTVGQLKAKVAQLEKAKGQKLGASEIRQVLDMEINERLAIQAARKENIKVSDTEMNTEIDRLKQQMSEAEFAQAIKQQTGLSLPDFRRQLETQLVIQKYLLQKKGALFREIKEPDGADIGREYEARELIKDETLDKGGLTQKESVAFVGIVSDTRAAAQELEKEIGRSVKKFEEKAQELSRSSPERIVRGVMKKDNEALNILGAEALKQVFALPCNPDTGEKGLSGVLAGAQNKYFIVEVIDRCSFRSPLKLSDKVFPYDETVRDLIKAQLVQQKQMEALQKAQEELVSELRKGNPFSINEANLKLVSG